MHCKALGAGKQLDEEKFESHFSSSINGIHVFDDSFVPVGPSTGEKPYNPHSESTEEKLYSAYEMFTTENAYSIQTLATDNAIPIGESSTATTELSFQFPPASKNSIEGVPVVTNEPPLTVSTESDVELSPVDLDIAAESITASIDSLIGITPKLSYLSNQISDVFDSKDGGGQDDNIHYSDLITTTRPINYKCRRMMPTMKKPRTGIG